MTIEINGMAHVILTVSDFDASRVFYCELLPFLGMKKVYDGNNFVYHIGGRTALGIQRCAKEHEGRRFEQIASGSTISVCAPARATMSTRPPSSCGKWVPISIEARWSASRPMAITFSFSKIRTASGSRSTTYRAKAF